MIRQAFHSGLALTFMGAAGLFFGLETTAVMATGASLSTLALTIHVGGKVVDDSNKKSTS